MFQDIKSTKPSLREVLPKGRKKEMVTPPAPLPPPTRKRRSKFWPMVFLLVFIVAVLWIITEVLASAVVEITPKQVAVPLSETITAYKTSAPVGELTYEVITTPPLSQSQTLPATGSQVVNTKASGQVIIYNNYSSASQLLIKTTRLESTDGKIYRLTSGVTVPGQKTVAGKLVPGAVQVGVIADAAGPSYNIGLTDFTIFGFKGQPRYSKFYARSKTPMTGGASGTVKVLAPADKAKAVETLRELLTRQALTAVRTQIPDGFILYDDAVVTNFTEEINSASTSDAAVLKETAVLNGFVFDKNNLSKRLVVGKLDGATDADFSIPNLADLKLTLNNSSTVNPTSDSRLSMTINGTAQVVMTLDQAVLKAKLAGASKDEAPTIFREFPAIETASVSFRPPWLRHFPSSVDKISISPQP